jgi:hypothetical protein
MIEPEAVLAATDVVEGVSEEATHGFGFEHAISMRRALQQHIAAARQALSDVESEMVRQVEKNAKTIDGVTYTRGAVKSFTTDHERLLSVAYQRALQEATQPDGNIDWEALGEYYGNIMTTLYLSPSTKPKVSGLEFLGVGKKQYTTERINGWKLLAIGEDV